MHKRARRMDEDMSNEVEGDGALDGDGDGHEVVVVKTWFDRNKNKKRSEVVTQGGTRATLILFLITVLPAYCDTVGTREKCHHKQMSQ